MMNANSTTSTSLLPVYTVTLPQSNDNGEQTRTSAAVSSDAIKIVPPYEPQVWDVAASAKLTYRNGHLLSAVEVVTTFWGEAWQQQPESDTFQSVRNFFDFILSSELMDQLAEYGVEGQPIKHGKHVGAFLIKTSSPLGSQISDEQLRQLLQSLISNNPTFPQPNSNRLYFVYLPPGVEVASGQDLSCHKFCGYHNAMEGGIFYAIMPYPCQGNCTGELSILDALTSVSSHELCEAITDANPGQGWYDDNGGEIGDICAWQQKKVGDFTVQKEWSNQKNACI